MRNGVFILTGLCCLLCSGCPKSSDEDPQVRVDVRDNPGDVHVNPPDVDVDVTIPEGVVDTAAPEISAISGIVSGQDVNDSVTVYASATDDVGVTSFTLSVDGTEIAATSGEPIQFTWEAGSVPAGAHNFVFHAQDAAGNADTERVEFTTGGNGIVTNPGDPDTAEPIISSISGLTVNVPATGTVQILAAATDNVGVTSLSMSVDGLMVVSESDGDLTFNWDTQTVSDGIHEIEFTAKDAAGNSSIERRSVTVDNNPG